MKHEYAIQVRGLRKDYGRVEALRGVDLDVRRGTLLALLGPNGSGKTTVVKTLSTLTRPSRGSVVVNGYDVTRRRNGVRSSIGMVSQFVALDRLHSGRENLVLLGRLQKLSKTNATRRAAQLLERFELTEAADRPVKTYSGGMKRRLDLAVSLIVTPPVLLLDEPTTGLDPRSRAVLWEAIRQLLGEGITILLTTQYLEEADRLADQIAVLNDGRIIALGTAAQLKQGVGRERVAVVLSGPEDFRRAGDLLVGPGLTRDPETRTISLAIDGPSRVKHLLDVLAEHRLAIDSLSLTKPTLDDVFFALTQRASDPPDADSMPARREPNDELGALR